MASKKNAKKATKALTATQLALVANAASIGYAVQGAFEAAVVLARSVGQKSKAALRDVGLAYKAGYVARSLESNAAYLKRVGNMDETMRCEQGALIYAKSGPDTAKPSRRTHIEDKACRAADVSWRTAQVRAFNIVPTKRKPRPASNDDAPKAPPVDMVKASPKLDDKAAVNAYFVDALAALLTTCNVNAKKVVPQISSAIEDCKRAIDAAVA